MLKAAVTSNSRKKNKLSISVSFRLISKPQLESLCFILKLKVTDVSAFQHHSLFTTSYFWWKRSNTTQPHRLTGWFFYISSTFKILFNLILANLNAKRQQRNEWLDETPDMLKVKHFFPYLEKEFAKLSRLWVKPAWSLHTSAVRLVSRRRLLLAGWVSLYVSSNEVKAEQEA